LTRQHIGKERRSINDPTTRNGRKNPPSSKNTVPISGPVSIPMPVNV
jgi:hypothetical protein